MLIFEPLDITASSVRNILVQWFLEPTNDDLGLVTYDIFRAFSDTGTYTKIGEAPSGQFYFMDTDAPAVSKWDTVWYKVVANGPGSPVESDPAHMLGIPPARILVINNHARIVYRSHNGTPVLVYKKRREGTRCPRCYDPLEGVVTDDSCPVCFGAGFVTGYYPPIKTNCLIYPAEEKRDFMSHNHEAAITKAVMLRYPVVRVNDVLYEENHGRWWYVGQLTPIEDRRILVSQEATLKQADPHDKIIDLLSPKLTEHLLLPVV